ncbi:MAG: Fe(3+) dicitrate ABC transporter substrate-binding protein [Cardiobacterium sp.]
MYRRLFLAALAAFSFAAHAAVTVKDEHGSLTLDKTPTRVVALEFSFVDALANVGVSPVGVADDNKADRIIAPIRDLIQPWTPVGTRAQPNMETIASLKPDLIIADKDRHAAAYDELSKIAPVLLLNSRYGSLDDILAQAQVIGDAVGKHDEMKAKVDALNKEFDEIKAGIPAGQTAIVGASRENTFDLFSGDYFAGGVVARLGFKLPPPVDGKAFYEIGLEQFLAQDPDWLFVAHYREESVVRKWEKESLWSALKVANPAHNVSIEPDLWARSRGLIAARLMAEQVRDAVAKAK